MSPCHPFRPVPGQFGPNRRGPLPAPPFNPQDYWATRKLVSQLSASLGTKLDRADVVDPDAAAEAGEAADAKGTYEELGRILAKLAEKADRATTLAGYGITDAATKTEIAAKADLTDGKVPAAQLPSYVDDVLEYDTMSAFPATGESSKIYVAKDTNLVYRWSGTQYVEISPSPVLDDTVTEASPNGVRSSGIWSWVKSLLPRWLTGDYAEPATVASVEAKADKSALDAHVADTDNPHGVTAAQIGALPLVEDENGERTAVTIGSRAGSEPVGPYSLVNGDGLVASGAGSRAEGSGTTASGDLSHAEGNSTHAKGYGSHAEGNSTTANAPFSRVSGVNSETELYDDYACAWNGDVEVSYKSHGPGTFNVNPVGGPAGFFIGEQTLPQAIDAQVNAYTKAETDEKLDGKLNGPNDLGIVEAGGELDALTLVGRNEVTTYGDVVVRNSDDTPIHFLSLKANRAEPSAAVINELATLDDDGNPTRSGIAKDDVATKSYVVDRGDHSYLSKFGPADFSGDLILAGGDFGFGGPSGGGTMSESILYTDITRTDPGPSIFVSGYMFYKGPPIAEFELATKGDITSSISATNPTFSNAVLAVGLNIDTNSVAVLNEIAETFGGFPLEGTATTVGGLLAALAAAAAWLKKNKVGSFASVGGASATVENGVAKLDDFFTESNGLLTGTIAAKSIPGFSSSSTYEVGEIVIYDGVAYKCVTAITTAEEWTAAHWTLATNSDLAARLKGLKNDGTATDAFATSLLGKQIAKEAIDAEIIEKGTAPDAHLEAPTDDRLKLILADNSVAYDSAKALPYKLTSVIGDRVIAAMTLTAASTDITLPTIAANDTTVKDFILDVTNAYAVEGVATDAGINIPRTDFKLVTRDGESLTDVTTVKAGKSAFICFTQKSPVVVDGTTYPCWCVIQLPFGDPS